MHFLTNPYSPLRQGSPTKKKHKHRPEAAPTRPLKCSTCTATFLPAYITVGIYIYCGIVNVSCSSGAQVAAPTRHLTCSTCTRTFHTAYIRIGSSLLLRQKAFWKFVHFTTQAFFFFFISETEKMECRELEITLISARNLENVRKFFKKK